MKKLNGKAYKEYNSIDLRKFWCQEFQQYTGEAYSPHGFGGNELKTLKELLEIFNVYSVLLAIINAIKEGCRSISFFADQIDSYLPDHNFHKIEFCIKRFGDEEKKKKWRLFKMLEYKWFSDGSEIAKKKELFKDLTDWVEELNGRL